MCLGAACQKGGGSLCLGTTESEMPCDVPGVVALQIPGPPLSPHTHGPRHSPADLAGLQVHVFGVSLACCARADGGATAPHPRPCW